MVLLPRQPLILNDLGWAALQRDAQVDQPTERDVVDLSAVKALQ